MKLGASLTPVTVIVNDCGAEVSTPPSAVPPLSCATSVIVALPLAFAAVVKVSTPADETAGAVLKSAALVLPVTTKLTTWPASSAGPGLMPVAQPTSVCGPPSSARSRPARRRTTAPGSGRSRRSATGARRRCRHSHPWR